MEPFVVICETCRARLKVRSEAAIGEIHACPRCESMVHIVLPASAGAPLVTPQPPVRRSAQFARVEQPTQEAADAFAAAAVAVLSGAAMTPPADIAPIIDVHAASVAAATASSESGALARLNVLWLERPLMLLGGAAAATLVLVGGLSIAIWPGGDDASESTTRIVAARPIASDETPLALSVDRDEPAPVVAVAPPIDDPSSDQKAASPTSTAALAKAGEPGLPSPGAPAIVPPVETAGTQETRAAAEAAQVANAAEPNGHSTDPPPDSRHAPVFTLDPLSFDPSRLSLPTGGPPAGPNDASLAAASVRRTGNDAQPSTANATADAGDPLQGPTAPQENPTITVRRGPPMSETTQQPDVASRLALPVRAMNLQGAPLVQVLNQISDLAGVPITLDPAALELTGVSPRREVTISVENTTIDGLLKDLLTRQRLGVVERRGQLVVVRPTGNSSLPPTYDVSDLVAAGHTDAGRVATLIQQFVAPDSWEAMGGAGAIAVQGATLQIKQDEQIHIGLIVFCERLRVARGLPPKSRYPVERLRVESPYAQLADKLAQPTTFTFVPWTRLADVVRDWSARSGVTFLVDWQALADLELTPSSPIAASAIARTWEDALDEILAPLELAWRAVDGETIQITSAAAAERLRTVEFFKAPDRLREQFAHSAALVDGLKRELADKVGPSGAAAEIAVDGQRLIVLGNAAAHRYLTNRLAGE